MSILSIGSEIVMVQKSFDWRRDIPMRPQPLVNEPKAWLSGWQVATMLFGLLLGLGASSAGYAQNPYLTLTEAELMGMMQDKLPNPYLAYLPEGATPDYEYWEALAAMQAGSSAVPPGSQLLIQGENEPNDSQGTADFVAAFGTGVGDDPAADVTATLGSGDVDYFSFDLAAGDIIGASVSGGGNQLALFDPAELVRIISNFDASFIYPPASPLPGGGNAVLAYVVEVAGRYAIRVDGAGGYVLSMRVFRPVLEAGTVGDRQIIFLDFNGATLDTSIFGGVGNATLSPLSSFLAGWGLAGVDEDDVIDAILESTRESLDADLSERGLNPIFGIEIQNSRDNPDSFGAPNTSRVIVGGSIAEFGISTIGIAQSIDPGNFTTSETGVVLLDLLSAPSPNLNSLNTFQLSMSATILDLVGVGVGNIVSHEAGHYLGNFHTENGFVSPSAENIMDSGGNLPNTVGVGPDFIFGSGDDVDVDFGVDEFSGLEIFFGIEDTLNTTGFGSSLPDTDRDGIADEVDNCLNTPNGPTDGSNQVDIDQDGYGNACDADFNQSGFVLGDDIGTILGCFNAQPPISGGPAEDPTCEESDLDGDGFVLGSDISIAFAAFNGTPGPSGLGCADPTGGTAPCYDQYGLGDTDGDSVDNLQDTCVLLRNGPTDQSNQIDTDQDGFGNLCDADFNQSGFVLGDDIGTILSCFNAQPPISGGPAEDPTCEESDLDGDGFVLGSDISIAFAAFNETPGPSGLSCAGITTACP